MATDIQEALDWMEADPENRATDLTIYEGWPIRFGDSSRPAFKDCQMQIKARLKGDTDPEGWVLLRLESKVTGITYTLFVLELEVEKPGNPVKVHYSCRAVGGGLAPPDIILSGVYRATFDQVREMWRYAQEIKPHVPKGKRTTAKYKPYIERWQAGERYEDLLAEWEEKNPEEPTKYFYKAFWRVGYRTRK